jgi:hypothetical protein
MGLVVTWIGQSSHMCRLRKSKLSSQNIRLEYASLRTTHKDVPDMANGVGNLYPSGIGSDNQHDACFTEVV